MVAQMKSFFGQDSKLSKFIFGGILLVIFSLTFGSTIFAQFTRTDGPAGWSWGNGYGYGYGYGFDHGYVAGYRTTNSASSTYLYGYGYGYMTSDVTYNNTTGYQVNGVSSSTMTALVLNGGMTPNGSNIQSTSQVTFNAPTTLIVSPSVTVSIPSGTTLTSSGATDFSQLSGSNSVSANDLLNVSNIGSMQFGLPSLGLTVSPAITISINVGASYNGQTLTIYRKDGSSGSWVAASVAGNTQTACVVGAVTSGVCTFTTNELSSFLVGIPVGSSNTTSSSYSSGGWIPVASSQAQQQQQSAAASVASGYNFTKDLTIGSKGADVTALQNLLGVSPATGYFGKITQTALIKYQKANGIAPAAGYFGAKTRKVVNSSSMPTIAIKDMTLKQLIQMLINIGAITPDKIDAANKLISTL